MAKTDNTVQEAIADINDSENVIYLPDHDGKIAELAYYKAETRGFAPGCELDDWLEAEQEVALCHKMGET
jgi:hypothetical protein